jgi:hypothetical protein
MNWISSAADALHDPAFRAWRRINPASAKASAQPGARPAPGDSRPTWSNPSRHRSRRRRRGPQHLEQGQIAHDDCIDHAHEVAAVVGVLGLLALLDRCGGLPARDAIRPQSGMRNFGICTNRRSVRHRHQPGSSSPNDVTCVIAVMGCGRSGCASISRSSGIGERTRRPLIPHQRLRRPASPIRGARHRPPGCRARWSRTAAAPAAATTHQTGCRDR